jgi:hypothetical protein
MSSFIVVSGPVPEPPLAPLAGKWLSSNAGDESPQETRASASGLTIKRVRSIETNLHGSIKIARRAGSRDHFSAISADIGPPLALADR